MLALLLALATGLGGFVVLGTIDAVPGDGARFEIKARDSAVLIAERVEEALNSVGRDLGLVGESLAFHAPEAVGDAAGRLFAMWQRLRPDPADIVLTDRAGRVLAASAPRIVGADLSGSSWFTGALAGMVIGEAAAGSRAGAAVPRNLIVALPVRNGPSSTGVVAVQLSQGWIDAVVTATRRALPEGGRGLSIQVLNGSGSTLHRSGPEVHGPDISATVGDVRQGGVGWLVSVRMPPPTATGIPALLLLGAVLFAAGFGWLVGVQCERSLAYAAALGRQTGSLPQPVWSLTGSMYELQKQIRAVVELSASRERLLHDKRLALARSRDRIRAIRALTGSSCWEIDLATGQVVWTDGDESESGAAPERVCALGDILAHLEPEDRAAIGQAFVMVRADRGAVRDVIVRTRAGTDRISGRRLALRVAASASGSTKLYALSREYIEPTLSAPRILPIKISA